MTVILYRSRSCRTTVTIPGDSVDAAGAGVIVENLDGTGLRMSFRVRKALTPGPDEGEVTLYNLGPDKIGLIESQRGSPGSLLDLNTYGDNTGWGQPRSALPESALVDGLALVNVEAGYDGTVSSVWEAITAQVQSSKADNTTSVTKIRAYDNLDGALFNGANRVYLKGAPIFEVIKDLLLATGMVRGNFDEATWTSLVGVATLSDNYTVTGDAYEILNKVFEFLRTADNRGNVRWFQTNGAFFVYRDDQFVPGPPVELPPVKARPQRDDSGKIVVKTFLAPLVTPGRLVTLTPEATSIAQLGGLASVPQIQRAAIPPGVYRCDAVEHVGDTDASGQYTTTTTLWPAAFGEAA